MAYFGGRRGEGQFLGRLSNGGGVWGGVRVLLVLTLLTCFGEFIARVFITTPSNQQYDAQLGWVYEPNSIIFSSREGGADLQLNSIGFNDQPMAQGRGRGRLVFVGDSMTEALQVRQEDNFTSVLERLDPRIEAVNLGRSSMGPAHYGPVLDRYVSYTKGDLAIAVLTRGDLLDLLRGNVEVTRDSNDALETMSLRPVPEDRFKEVLGPFLRKSSLLTHLARRLKPTVTGIVKPLASWVKGTKSGDGGSKLDQAYVQLHEEEVAKRLSFTLMEVHKKWPLVVIYIPALNYDADGEVSHTFPWEGRIYAGVTSELGIPYFDTSEALAEVYRTSGQPPHGFSNAVIGKGHLNEEGHEAVGRALHRWLGNRESMIVRMGENP